MFGQIVNTECGDWWPMRKDVAQAGVHAPLVAGISGNGEVGCWSIALSGGYDEDIDLFVASAARCDL